MNRTAILALALFCGAVVGCGSDTSADEAATVVVSRGDLVFANSYYGEIEAAEAHPVFAPEMRNMWQVTVESVVADGTVVKKGDTVLTFARGSVEADLRDRETELRVAEASLRKVIADYDDQRINASLTAKRAELSVELAKMNVVEGVNLISKIDLEKARVELTRAELQLELARKEVEVLEKKRAAAVDGENITISTARQKVADVKAQLSRMTVAAPADGVLYAPYTRLNWVMSKVAPGRVVRPGDKLLEIPELDRFKASIYVRQREASNIKVGDKAVVVPTMFPDLQVPATVLTRDEFATTRNERTGSSGSSGTLKELRVVLELSKVDQPLRPGGTVRADIATVLAKDVVLVPLAALKEKDGGFVVVKRDGKEVKVSVGQTSLTHAEVTSGVQAGDEVRLGVDVVAKTPGKDGARGPRRGNGGAPSGGPPGGAAPPPPP